MRCMVVLEFTQSVVGLVSSVLSILAQVRAGWHKRDASEPMTWRPGGRSTDAQAVVKLRLDGR
jgi:hypothetical protein